ncbi:hypothetical protein Tco_0993019 [Tanacetum coccineum]|uniref:Uncharacterized protein n=1 Tax=Tanacetum coccineum TaxID=301880 RepID=A0ABQ5F464_9ASTR
MRETHDEYISSHKMALPAQNINHSAFRSMFDNEKLSGTNFNDCMTPTIHSKLNVSSADMIPEASIYVFEKQARVEKFDLSIHFPYMQTRKGKILNGLTKDFAGFVSNYKMHNMGRTIGEIHAMLMEYEKSLPKKAETPQVMMIKKGKIQKANKKSLKVKGKVIGKGKDYKKNKIVVARYAEFFEKRLINQEISGRAVDLEEIQEQEDTSPSEITSNIPQEVEGFGPPPQEEEIPIRRSAMEALWIRKFSLRLAAVHYANNREFKRAQKTQPLENISMFARALHGAIIKILKVTTDNNLADAFYKGIIKYEAYTHARSKRLHLLVVHGDSV